jgi:glycerate kinase
MKKFVLIPDSFKGTMSSSEICEIMGGAITARFPAAEIVKIPVADGGEGSVDAFLAAMGGQKIKTRVKNPFFEDIESFYGLTRDGSTAVIEMAAAAGLPLVLGRENPLTATTFGVGELVLHTARAGVKHIIIGLGGSCTNDGGCGMAAALGVQFFDQNGRTFIPTGGTLCNIESIGVSEMAAEMKGVHVTAMCDIDNPLFGESGAAYVFAPQKGASDGEIPLLDNGLRHLAAVLARSLGKDVADMPGAGAAGGFGAGICAFLGAELKPGINAVLEMVGFSQKIQGASMIFTGEGRIDSQSFRGKVPIGVARAAKPFGLPVVAVVGDIDGDMSQAYGEGIYGIFSINRKALNFEASKKTCREDLRLTVDNILRFCQMIIGD